MKDQTANADLYVSRYGLLFPLNEVEYSSFGTIWHKHGKKDALRIQKEQRIDTWIPYCLSYSAALNIAMKRDYLKCTENFYNLIGIRN